MIIRVLTLAGPRDIEVVDWDRTEAMLATVSVMALEVPAGAPYPALIVVDNSAHIAQLKPSLRLALARYEWCQGDNWALRHSEWVCPGGQYRIGGS